MLTASDGFLLDRYWLCTHRPLLFSKMEVHPDLSPLVIETFVPALSTVIRSASVLGWVRTLSPVVVYRTPTTLSEAATAAGFGRADCATIAAPATPGTSPGSVDDHEGVELSGARYRSRLSRDVVSVGAGAENVLAEGAGTAYDGWLTGSSTRVTAVATTPTTATGIATRRTLTAVGGRSARRGRGRDIFRFPRVMRPNRYLPGESSHIRPGCRNARLTAWDQSERKSWRIACPRREKLQWATPQ